MLERHCSEWEELYQLVKCLFQSPIRKINLDIMVLL